MTGIYIFFRFTPEDWIGLLGILEAKDNRRCAARDVQNTAAKKKISDQPNGKYDNSQTIPRVTFKKRNPNPGKGHQ